MTATVLRNGRIVTAVDDYVADVLLADGVVRQIGMDIAVGPDVAQIDAKGMLVLPGGVDTHVHLENVIGPTVTCDTFESGTRAAAFGGTTTIVDFALQTPETGPLGALARMQQSAEPQVCIDYGAHIIIRQVDAQSLADVRHAMRHEGVTSFKMFMAYPGVMMADDASIFRMLRQVGHDGGMVALHAENGTVIELLIQEALAAGHTSPKYHALTRPALMEGEATHRGLRLAELAEAPVYFVHVSSDAALRTIVEARDLGIPAFAETCPHYLLFDDTVYEGDEFDIARFVMTPPLRKRSDQDRLWRALRFDDLQVIATDHCPFCMKEGHLGFRQQKQAGLGDFSKIPNGAPGIETRLTSMYDLAVVQNRLSLNRLVELTATNPAKLFGLFPRKGTIAIGCDADIIL
ncbi:MAG TPA: dihydropyrimidinase, partial [Dongiaceae bacterium]